MNITEKSVNLLPETLQVGDYIPFIEINGEGRKKHIHNYCNNKPFMFITIRDINSVELHETFLNLSNNFDVIVLFEEGKPVNIRTNVLYTKDEQLKKILMIGNKSQVYITSPNRRIISIMDSDQLREMKHFNIEDYLPKEIHIPYLLIENALDNDLLKKVINFYNQKKTEGKLISHQHSTKDRLHVHPDAELEKELDHKISRSVLPELRKVFYFDVEYRELYKILDEAKILDYDIILLAHNWYNRQQKKPVTDNISTIGLFYGLQSYIITPKCAKYLCERFKDSSKWPKPDDVTIGELSVAKDIKVFTSTKKLVTLHELARVSDTNRGR